MRISSLYFLGIVLSVALASGCASSMHHGNDVPGSGIIALNRTIIKSFTCQDATISTLIMYISNIVREQSGTSLHFYAISDDVGDRIVSLDCKNISAMELLSMITARCELAMSFINNQISLVSADHIGPPGHPLLILAEDGTLCPIFLWRDYFVGFDIAFTPAVPSYGYMDAIIKFEGEACGVRQAFNPITEQAHVTVDIRVENETTKSKSEWDKQYVDFENGELTVRELLSQAVWVMNEIGFPRSSVDKERDLKNGYYKTLAYLMEDKIVIRTFWILSKQESESYFEGM
jgi:hypothetical protein